jgi:C1A family cysteine protease
MISMNQFSNESKNYRGDFMSTKWILGAVIALAAQGSYAAQQINVATLNQQLKAQNAGWVAKETYLSHLSKAEVQHRFGLNEKLSPEVEFVRNSPKALTGNLPATLDWRNKDGANWVSPLLNQANCGSCVAFASIGTMETQMRIASGNPNYNISLSTENLFMCGGASCETGWMPTDAADFLQSKGVVDEACSPYTSGASGSDVACSAVCKDADKRTYKITGYSQPTSYFKDIDAVRQALQKGPLVTTIMVNEDFMSYSSGVYKHTTGKFLGGHAISIVGYDDTTQSFIIRNSWGPEWGENGFGHVSYTDVSGVGSQTWAFQIPSVNGSVFIQSPRDYTYASNKLALKTESTIAGTDSLQVTVLDSSGKAVISQSCAKSCEQNVDINALPAGRYEIQTVALDSVGHAVGHSPNQSFYVANQQPQITLSFAGKTSDFKSPVKDRIEFSVKTSTTSVPLSGLEFHYRNANGKEVSKAINVVLSDMSLGWRTNLVPNGIYEVWMVGHLKTNAFDVVTTTPHISIQTQS